MRLLSLNFGDESCASSQFRIHAYRELLRGHGIEIEAIAAAEFESWDRVPEFDAVIVQKKLFNTGQVQRLRRQARRLIYDIDDAIWEPHGRRHHWLTRWRTRMRLKAIARAADLCLVANEVIGSHLRPWARRLEVFPMALDETVWHARTPPTSSQVTLGWSGAPGNLGYLESLEPALLEIRRRHPELKVKVLCGKSPGFRELLAEHVPWRQGEEPGVVRTFDVGLLPLDDNPFAAGKSPIKGLQYMASGISTVATPLAATRELFGGDTAARFARSSDEWTRALDTLVSDSTLRANMGRAASEFFQEHHALSKQAARLAKLLQSA